MARNQKSRNNNVIYGICTNTEGKEDGMPCSKCQNKERQAIRASKEFVCEECGEPLQKIEAPPPPTKIIIIIAIAVVAIGAAIGAIYGFKDGKLSGLFGGSKNDQVFYSVIDKDAYNMKVGETDTVKVTYQPLDAEVNVSYSSENENVAVVTNAGVLHAVGAGKTTVTAIVQFSKNHSDTLSASVTVKKKEVGNGSSVNVGYGSYSGPMKGGKAHGVGGTIRVTSNYSIDLKDGRGGRLDVYPGETIVNTKFVNGHLRQGELHRNDGTRKWFNI